MQLRSVLLAAVGLGLAICPAWGTSLYGPARFDLSGGWAFPADERLSEGWEPGLTASLGFRSHVAPNVMGGIEVAYFRHPIDSDFFEQRVPGLSLDGGDAHLIALTTQTEVFLVREEGGAKHSIRPFLGAGFGFYILRISEFTATGAPASFDLSLDDEYAFGMHGGAGVIFEAGSWGIRLDGRYHHVFLPGKNIGDVPIRLGLVFGRPG